MCRMLATVQAKIDIIDHKVQEVIKLFKPLVSMGIPFFWEEMGPLLTQEEYLERLILYRAHHNKFGDMQHALSGPILFEKLAGAFELLADYKATCTTVPDFSYTENTKLKVLAHDMVVAIFPGPNLWKSIQLYGSKKFSMQPQS